MKKYVSIIRTGFFIVLLAGAQTCLFSEKLKNDGTCWSEQKRRTYKKIGSNRSALKKGMHLLKGSSRDVIAESLNVR